MRTYFWSARRTTPSDAFPHLNYASGFVEAENYQDAVYQVEIDARSQLGNTKQFVIVAFNIVV